MTFRKKIINIGHRVTEQIWIPYNAGKRIYVPLKPVK
jgi:hypothetical protein